MTLAVPTVLWLAVVPLVLLILDISSGATGAAWPRVRRLWAGPSGFSSAAATRSRRRWLLWLGMIAVIVAAARPQWGRVEEQTFDQSREVLIALDLSRSMLAEDIKPSRLARAKLLIESLLDRLKGERVGLVLFSGTAFLQSPLSSDYEVLREFLPALGPDYLPEGGTDFDRLLATALDSFSNEGGADRFMIVLSDGESQTTEWRNRIDRMTQRNIRVIALGIGTEGGAVMPAEGGGFVKDSRGAVVLSRLEPQTLRDLARLTRGTYANATQWVDLAELLEQTVERGRQGEFTKRAEMRLQERYQWFLAAGLVLLAWSFWREFPVRPRVRDMKGRVATAASALAVLVLFSPADANTAPGDLPELAKSLSAQRSLSADDAARFAGATIDYGTAQKQSGQPIPPTVLHDGFAAVDLGERSDRTAADWPELRRKLEELARPPEQEKQDKEEEQKQEEEKKDQQQQQGGGTDDQQQNQSEQQDQEEQQQDEQGGQQQNQEQDPQGSGQKAFEEPPQDQQQEGEEPEPQDSQQQPQSRRNMQTVGGESAADTEIQERPELAVPLQKLDRVKQQDSPPRLFQLMQDDEPKKPTRKERDW
jgi:Ca-activated chloride channel homolog